MPDYLLIPILLILSTFFSGMEIAFISANRLMIELDRKKGIGGSKVVSWLNSKLEAIVVTSLIGYIICLVIYGLRMAMVVEPMIGQIVIHPGWIQLIQILLATAIILITAELIPRTIFRMKANLMIRLFSYPFLIFFVLLSPLTYLTIGLSNFLRTRVLRKDGTPRTRQLLFGRADLHNLIDDTSSEHTGEEQPDQEVRLIQNVMEFPSIKLRECMVPRNEMLTIEVNESVEELKQEFIHSGHSRILVYEEDIDHIIGYIHHADLFRNPLNIREMIRPVPFVPETMPANKLLTGLLDNRQNIAVVIDEFGGTAGLVSGEDILEEIFGEIEDEHDSPHLEETQITEHQFRFSGRLEIDYLNETYGLNLPVSDDYETLAGLILYHNPSLPKVNDSFHIGPYTIRILKSSHTRIEIILLSS